MKNVPETKPRVILLCTTTVAADIPANEDFPSALLPLGAGSFLTQILHLLADFGIKQVDLVTSDQPEAFHRVVDGGAFWGLTIKWHLAKSALRPYGAVRHLAGSSGSRTILGHADHWISADLLHALASHKDMSCEAHCEAGWTGWANLADAELLSIAPDSDFSKLGEQLAQSQHVHRLLAKPSDHTTPVNASSLLAAQHLSNQEGEGPAIPAHWIRKPWGAMSPDARVNPSAVLHGPVVIGPRCIVGRGTRLGPDVVLASDVIVSSGTDVRNAVILPNTFLGADLDLHDVVVNGNRLHNNSLGISLVIDSSEGTLLSLNAPAAQKPGLSGRLVATLAILALGPFFLLDWLLLILRHQPTRWTTREAVVGRDQKTNTLNLCKLRIARHSGSAFGQLMANFGVLLDIAAGHQCWFGIRARTIAEWYSLHKDWQVIFSSAPIGLFNAPAWEDEENPSEEAAAAADAYFATQPKGWQRLKICASILNHTVRKPRKVITTVTT